MNEDQMNRIMMIAGMCLAVITAIGSISLLVMAARDFTVPLAAGSFLLALATIGFEWSAVYFGRKVTGHPLVFTNEAEREVLNPKQRRELRRARGEVVMDRALTEIEHERDNIVHRALEAANDPERPPHQTQWTTNPKNLADKRKATEHGWLSPEEIERKERGGY